MFDVKYSIAIRKKSNKIEFFWDNPSFMFQECQIDSLGKYWFADPFVFAWKDVTYIFFEAFDLVSRKGKIGYCILNKDGSCTIPKIVIDEDYHLSFPNVFIDNGDIYMMPESCGDNTVKLYRAVSFPDVWEASETILPDSFACDSVLINTDGSRYLLTNELYRNVPGKGSQGCYVKLLIYKINHFTTQDYGIRIKDGDDGVRNAGKVFNIKDKLYRVGQDCRNREYGRGLVFYEIDSIEAYIEHEVSRFDRDIFESHIKRNSAETLLGVHTYNFNDNYEVIDFYIKKDPSGTVLFKRKFSRYWNFLKRHL